MMGEPTKFNHMCSGVVGSEPAPLNSDETSRLVNAPSLGATSYLLMGQSMQKCLSGHVLKSGFSDVFVAGQTFVN